MQNKIKKITITFVLGICVLILSCVLSVINRDGAFTFEMLPIPLAFSAIAVLILTIFFGISSLIIEYFIKKEEPYISLSLFYIVCMFIIGWCSAPQAIF